MRYPDYDARLRALDEYLYQVRGWISHMPERDASAVVLFSGGLDSVVLAARLIVEHGLTVYPLHIVRGQSNLDGENRSVAYYGDALARRFGRYFAPVRTVSIVLPVPELRDSLADYVNANGYPCRDNLFCLYAIQYALTLKSDEPVRSIFTSAITSSTFAHDTLLALRSTTVLACSSTPYSDWNITAPNIDPNLHGERGPFGKVDLVRWASENDLSLAHTFTCIVRGDAHCGDCQFCVKRRVAFAEAGVRDETVYAI